MEQATALATESLTLNRQQEDHYGNSSATGNSLALLGLIAFLQGHLPQAQRYFQEVITIAATFNYATMRCEWQPLLGLRSTTCAASGTNKANGCYT